MGGGRWASTMETVTGGNLENMEEHLLVVIGGLIKPRSKGN